MSKLFYPSYGVNELGVADIVISFQSNGAGAVDQTTIRGKKVASVTHTATGIFTVLLTEDVYQVLSVNAAQAGVTGGDKAQASVFVADETVSPLTFIVYTYADGAAATALSDPTAGRKISLVLKAKLSIGA